MLHFIEYLLCARHRAGLLVLSAPTCYEISYNTVRTSQKANHGLKLRECLPCNLTVDGIRSYTYLSTSQASWATEGQRAAKSLHEVHWGWLLAQASSCQRAARALPGQSPSVAAPPPGSQILFCKREAEGNKKDTESAQATGPESLSGLDLLAPSDPPPLEYICPLFSTGTPARGKRSFPTFKYLCLF